MITHARFSFHRLFSISRTDRFVLSLGSVILLLALATSATAQAPPDAAGEFERIADRYWQVLQQRPRKGTAFDLCYRHYQQADKLDALHERIDQAIESQPDAVESHLLQGLLHEREARAADALLAYEAAERLAPEDYYPAFCRGMLLFTQQRYEDAAAALSRALELQPPRGDVVEIVQALVRCQLRSGNRDAARQTWSEFSSAIAADPYTLRRLAEVVTAEGDIDGAMELWQQVVNQPQIEPLGRLTARIEIAQLHADRGESEMAVGQFREILGQLKPDGWLAHDVCRRIDRTFLQDENAAGLVAFWKERRETNPQDLETIQQLARAFGFSGQTDEAMATYRQALELAPTRGDLPRAFIEVLVDARELEEAIDQCEVLLEHSGTDVEVLRMLGQLYLKVASEAEQADAQEKAIETWRRIAESRPDDPAAALIAAEACRHSALVPSSLRAASDRLRTTSSNEVLLEAAEEFYRDAAERARTKDHHFAVPYLEHLGEFFHALEQPDEAIAAWQEIDAPPHDTAELILEAAGIFLKYGYLQEAEDAARRAVEPDPQSFPAVELLIDVLVKREDFEGAFAQLDRLDAVADTPVLQDEVRRIRVQVCTAGKFIDREIERLEEAIAVDSPAIEDLWLLGLLKSSAGRLDVAATVLKRAIEHSNDDPRLIRDFADILQRNRKLDEAARQYERLIAIEPHRRIVHYRMLVQLHMRRGDQKLAREVADKLAELAPNDAATHQLRIEVARRSGNRAEQIRLLREVTRAAPQDTAVRRQLAHTLADHGEYDDALAEFWRCWETTPALPERISLVAAMCDLLAKTGSQQPLIDRLQAMRKQQPRAVGICLAEAYRRTGDIAQGRRALTSLLAEDDRDVDVLRQLAALAAEEQDWQAALAYQQQVVDLDGAWTNILDWSRYYSESKRDEWLADSRERQRQLMQAWARAFREYRKVMQHEAADEPHARALRQELVNLNWARNKYHDKEQLLDPDSTYQRRYGDIWHHLRLDFEILELASRGPVTAPEIERRVADAIRKVRTSAESALKSLCEKGFLEQRTVEGEEQYVASLPADELLGAVIRDFGERMLGAEIELSDVEMARLERVVESAGEGSSR